MRSNGHVLINSEALGQQVKRLVAAGYPDHVNVAVAESMRRKFRACDKENHEPEKGKKEKVAVIPYVQRTSHNLKRIAQKANIKVVFSAPAK